MRIGAVIPRYNLEALLAVTFLSALRHCMQFSVPFMLDDLSKTVYHAIVSFFTSHFARLKLSMPFV